MYLSTLWRGGGCCDLCSCLPLVVTGERVFVEHELSQSGSASLGLGNEVSEFLNRLHLLLQILRFQEVTHLQSNTFHDAVKFCVFVSLMLLFQIGIKGIQSFSLSNDVLCIYQLVYIHPTPIAIENVEKCSHYNLVFHLIANCGESKESNESPRKKIILTLAIRNAQKQNYEMLEMI